MARPPLRSFVKFSISASRKYVSASYPRINHVWHVQIWHFVFRHCDALRYDSSFMIFVYLCTLTFCFSVNILRELVHLFCVTGCTIVIYRWVDYVKRVEKECYVVGIGVSQIFADDIEPDYSKVCISALPEEDDGTPGTRSHRLHCWWMLFPRCMTCRIQKWSNGLLSSHREIECRRVRVVECGGVNQYGPRWIVFT